VQSLNG